MEDDTVAVKVFVRFRPLNERERTEKSKGEEFRLDINAKGDGLKLQLKGKGHDFSFDEIFGERSEQSHVYDVAAKAAIDDVLRGYNATIFACKRKKCSRAGFIVDLMSRFCFFRRQ